MLIEVIFDLNAAGCTGLHCTSSRGYTWPDYHAYNKLDDIATILDNVGKGFHLFCLSEWQLRVQVPDSDLLISGYNTIRRDPKTSKETGLLLYHSQSIALERIFELEKYNVESLWVEIKLKHIKPLLMIFIYTNPSEKLTGSMTSV